MSGRWWRAYDEAVDDPKLQKLSGELFKCWFNLMCIASENDGVLPSIDDIAFKLRLPSHKAEKLIASLTEAGLLDEIDGTIQPHNWGVRQFKTDVTDPTNNERQKRYRNRKRNANDTVTKSVTDKRPDTEQIQNITEAEPRNAATVTPEVAIPNPASELRKRITEIYLRCGAEPVPDTGRAETWIAQGLDPAIITAVIQDITQRNKGAPKPLAYFEKPIREAHVKPPPKSLNGNNSIAGMLKPKNDAPLSLSMQISMAKGYSASRCEVWNFYDTPKPGRAGCPVDAEILRKYGVDPETGGMLPTWTPRLHEVVK